MSHGARQQWLLMTVWHGKGKCLTLYPYRVMVKWWWISLKKQINCNPFNIGHFQINQMYVKHNQVKPLWDSLMLVCLWCHFHLHCWLAWSSYWYFSFSCLLLQHVYTWCRTYCLCFTIWVVFNWVSKVNQAIIIFKWFGLVLVWLWFEIGQVVSRVTVKKCNELTLSLCSFSFSFVLFIWRINIG